MARTKKSSWSFTPLDFLLLALPVAVALRCVAVWRNDALLFVVAAIAIVPLAGWMGLKFGWWTPFWVLAIAGMALGIVVQLFVREPKRNQAERCFYALRMSLGNFVTCILNLE